MKFVRGGQREGTPRCLAERLADGDVPLPKEDLVKELFYTLRFPWCWPPEEGRAGRLREWLSDSGAPTPPSKPGQVCFATVAMDKTVRLWQVDAEDADDGLVRPLKQDEKSLSQRLRAAVDR